jgi:hypothetical protein
MRWPRSDAGNGSIVNARINVFGVSALDFSTAAADATIAAIAVPSSLADRALDQSVVPHFDALKVASGEHLVTVLRRT